ncbi:PspC domain-containing protein [Geodermatophilus sp. SYSU D00703]
MTSTPPVPDATTPRPVRPQLRRSGTDRMAGGVCGGLAEYSGVDPVLWRVGFVGLTLAGGAGVALYLLLWVLVPAGPATPGEALSPIEQLVRRLHDAITGSRARTPQG